MCWGAPLHSAAGQACWGGVGWGASSSDYSENEDRVSGTQEMGLCQVGSWLPRRGERFLQAGDWGPLGCCPKVLQASLGRQARLFHTVFPCPAYLSDCADSAGGGESTPRALGFSEQTQGPSEELPVALSGLLSSGAPLPALRRLLAFPESFLRHLGRRQAGAGESPGQGCPSSVSPVTN